MAFFLFNDMKLIDRLKVPVMVAGLGLAGIAGCGKGEKEGEKDIGEIKLKVMKENRLTENALDWLKARNVNIDSAKAYDERFLQNVEDIAILFQNGIMPSTVNAYDERFSVDAITYLYENGVSPEIADAYDKRFNYGNIVRFYRNTISPEIANSYDKELFSPSEFIVDACNAGLENKTALGYNERFPVSDRIDLYANDVLPETANKYHGTFSGDEIIALHKRESIGPGIANRYARLNELYGMRIGAEDVISFVQNKIPYDVVKKRAKELMVDEAIVK